MKIVSCFFTPDFPVPERFLSGMDVFFDIETTGLNWRRSHLYLIGAAIYHPESKIWELIQWFADEPARGTGPVGCFCGVSCAVSTDHSL